MHFARKNFVYSYDEGIVCYRAVALGHSEVKRDVKLNERSLSSIPRQFYRKNKIKTSIIGGPVELDYEVLGSTPKITYIEPNLCLHAGQTCHRGLQRHKEQQYAKNKADFEEQKLRRDERSGKNKLFSPIQNLQRTYAKRNTLSKNREVSTNKRIVGECKNLEKKSVADEDTGKQVTWRKNDVTSLPKITTLKSIITDYIHNPDEDRVVRLVKRRYGLLAMTRRDVYGTNDRFLNKEWALDSSSETTTVASRTSKTDLEPSVTRDVFMEENKGCYKADKEAVIKSVTGPAEPEDDEDEDATQNGLSKHASLDSIILPFDTKETQSIDRNIESKVVENEPLLTNERLRSKIDELERHLSGANEFEDAKLQNESSFHEQISHFLTNASISFEESLCGCDSPSIHKSGIYSAHKTTSEPRGKWEGIEIMKSLGDLSLGNSDFREETIVETGSINFKELYSHEQSPESPSVLKFQARVENLHSAPPKLECTGSHLLADSHSVQSTFHLPCDRTRSDITLLKSAKPHIGGSNLNPSQLYSIAQGFYEDEYKDSPLQACSHSSRTTLRSSKVSQELSQRTRSDEFQEEHGCRVRELQSYKDRLPQDEEAESATGDALEKTEYNQVKSKTHPLCRVSSIHKKDPRRHRTCLSLERLTSLDTRDDGTLLKPNFQEAKGRRIEKLKIRPLRHVRHKLLIDGFDATVYIINSSKRATSSLCTIMFDYDKDTLMIKSMNNLFEINATTLVSEEIPTVPNAPILLKLSVLNVKTSAVVIQSMNGRDLEILGGTIGWLENDGMGVQDDAMA